ncbi:MAG: hypothetical protein GY851_29040 [bacterium]|nr:hypothetical protein [bacterium]
MPSRSKTINIADHDGGLRSDVEELGDYLGIQNMADTIRYAVRRLLQEERRRNSAATRGDL